MLAMQGLVWLDRVEFQVLHRDAHSRSRLFLEVPIFRGKDFMSRLIAVVRHLAGLLSSSCIFSGALCPPMSSAMIRCFCWAIMAFIYLWDVSSETSPSIRSFLVRPFYSLEISLPSRCQSIFVFCGLSSSSWMFSGTAVLRRDRASIRSQCSSLFA